MKAWKKPSCFSKTTLAFEFFLLLRSKDQRFITGNHTIRNYHPTEKGSLQNHAYLSRDISLKVSESFNKFKYAFLKCYSNNVYIFILSSICRNAVF